MDQTIISAQQPISPPTGRYHHVRDSSGEDSSMPATADSAFPANRSNTEDNHPRAT